MKNKAGTIRAGSMGGFYEFFAGGGMARAGIGPRWTCLFANDFDPKKGEVYTTNWGSDALVVGDVNTISANELPGHADLVWASFPCQDLSLAGAGAGLKGERSGTFWPFWDRMAALLEAGRKPNFIVLENVIGMLTSSGGADFTAICNALSDADYRFGAVVVDAAHFVPQSRKRVFIVAIAGDRTLEPGSVSAKAHPVWHPAALQKAVGNLSASVSKHWLWWSLPDLPARKASIDDVIEDEPQGVTWHSAEETTRLLSMMSDFNVQKFHNAKIGGKRLVGTVYRRTRPSSTGGVQRAEIRLDGTAGCLRTPGGGSSRQIIVVAEAGKVRSRLISPREAARLMGLPDSYKLPANYNEAYHLLGDGLAVPAVSFVVRNLVEPNMASHGLKCAA